MDMYYLSNQLIYMNGFCGVHISRLRFMIRIWRHSAVLFPNVHAQSCILRYTFDISRLQLRNVHAVSLYIYILNSCYYQRHVFPHCFTKSVVEMKGMIVTYLTKEYKRHVERKADHLIKGTHTLFETGSPRPGLVDGRHSTQLTWSWVLHLNKIIKSHQDVYIQLFEVMLSDWTCAVFTFSYPSKLTSSSHMRLQTPRSWTW